MIFEKICKFCDTLKPISDFPFRSGHYLKTCDACYKERENLKQRLRYAEDPNAREKKIISARKCQWKSKYGVTPEEVYKALEEQDNKCSTCFTNISLDIYETHSKRAHLDHDHTTGKFRSLMCNRCNMVLGHIEKNRKIVENLLKYADKYKDLHIKE